MFVFSDDICKKFNWYCHNLIVSTSVVTFSNSYMLNENSALMLTILFHILCMSLLDHFQSKNTIFYVSPQSRLCFISRYRNSKCLRILSAAIWKENIWSSSHNPLNEFMCCYVNHLLLFIILNNLWTFNILKVIHNKFSGSNMTTEKWTKVLNAIQTKEEDKLVNIFPYFHLEVK